MCNAYGHPPGCRCGWGGDGHTGRRDPGQPVAPAMPRIARTYGSYVNPNATCPVCGCSVFFYQSPDGGRVFFDELGPPWPKHACTDHRISRGNTTPAPPLPQRQFSWQIAGWTPFFVSSVASYTPDLLRVSGTFDGTSIDLYVPKRPLGSLSDPRDTVRKSLVHIKRISADCFALTLFTPALRPVEVSGYTSTIEAANAARRAILTERDRVSRARSRFRSGRRAASASASTAARVGRRSKKH